MARCGLLPLKGSECTKLPALPEAAFTERVILQVAQNMLAELREHRSWAQAYQRVTLPDTRVEAPVELPTTTLAATLLAKVQSNESRLQAARSKLGVGINAIGATGADAAAAERAAEPPAAHLQPPPLASSQHLSTERPTLASLLPRQGVPIRAQPPLLHAHARAPPVAASLPPGSQQRAELPRPSGRAMTTTTLR